MAHSTEAYRSHQLKANSWRRQVRTISALLEDLKTALEAKQLSVHHSARTGVAFDAVVLGEKQSEDAGGGFSNKPPGDWVIVKSFLPKGDRTAKYF